MVFLPRKRGRKTKEINPLTKRVAELERQNRKLDKNIQSGITGRDVWVSWVKGCLTTSASDFVQKEQQALTVTARSRSRLRESMQRIRLLSNRSLALRRDNKAASFPAASS